jgi:hypothetical protein
MVHVFSKKKNESVRDTLSMGSHIGIVCSKSSAAVLVTLFVRACTMVEKAYLFLALHII